MGLARLVAQGPSALRWRIGRARTAVLRSGFRRLGSGTVIVRPYALRGIDRISIGEDCALFDGAWLQCESDDSATIEIGDHCYFGRDVHVHAIDPIRIGNDCVFADSVFVATTDHDADDRHGVHGTGPITIGDRVFLGQRAVVLGGVRIGDGATVGAHAVVTRDVPAGATVVGIPARPIGPR